VTERVHNVAVIPGEQTGEALSADAVETVRRSDATLKGPLGQGRGRRRPRRRRG
jgi:isocitrate/isopropylmalate dehydrogenase